MNTKEESDGSLRSSGSQLWFGGLGEAFKDKSTRIFSFPLYKTEQKPAEDVKSADFSLKGVKGGAAYLLKLMLFLMRTKPMTSAVM